jgi:site-specific recombinase XerD
LLKGFVEDCTLRGLQTHTITTYKADINDFLKHNPHPERVTHDELKKYLKVLKTRGLKVASQKRVFSSINAFYNYLVFEEYTIQNPVLSFRRRYLNSKEFDSESRRLITIQEVLAILENTNSILQYAFIMFLAKTGLRIGEALSLTVDDIDLEEMRIHVPFKAKRSRNIAYIDDELKEVLELYIEWRSQGWQRSDKLFVNSRGYALKKELPNKWLAEIGTELKIHNSNGPLHKKITCHCFRHFFTTHLHRAGMNEEFIKWLRGDAINESWQIYNHIDPEEVRDQYCACIPSLLVDVVS